MKRNKGITLIALIITIILMLILASVVLSLTLGENGIIKIAKQTVQKNSEAEAREKLEIALADLQAHKYVNENNNEDDNGNEYINKYLEKEGMILNEDIVTVNDWNFTINTENLEIIENLGKTEEINPNIIIGKQLSADFRKTLNGYTCTHGSGIIDGTLGLIPQTYEEGTGEWNDCCYEKTVNTPFNLAKKFEIDFNYKLSTSTNYEMGGINIVLQKQNEANEYEDVMVFGMVDSWERVSTIQTSFIYNNELVYTNQGTLSNYFVKVIGDETNIKFYLNDQCIATIQQEKDISIDKVLITFYQYPGHGAPDTNNLESIYFGDIRN